MAKDGIDMMRNVPKEPIIEAFKKRLDEAKVHLFTEEEVKIMLDRIEWLEGLVEEAYWDVMQASMGDDF